MASSFLLEEELPGLALAVEREELGIAAGLMDRVVQVYGGLVYMDLRTELLERRGRGAYERLDPSSLPPLFVAWRPALAEGSERVHGDLRRRWLEGDPIVLEAVARLAALTDRARALLRAGRGSELPPLMDENFEIRASLVPIHPGHRELVGTGRRPCAAVKFAGSGARWWAPGTAIPGRESGCGRRTRRSGRASWSPGRLRRKVRRTFAARSAHRPGGRPS